MVRELFRFPFSFKPKAKPVLPVPPEVARPQRISRLELLVPAFEDRVRRMLQNVVARGYRPRVWETLRTPERAQLLQARGSSKNGTKSLHLYGAAVDVICAEHKWSCKKNDCAFYSALAEEAKHVGLHPGLTLFPTFVDPPHVQAVSFRRQRALRRANNVAEFVRKELTRA